MTVANINMVGVFNTVLPYIRSVSPIGAHPGVYKLA
ncbi:hypothetical protein PSBY109024_15345 [Pseudoalteromonas byunsanensis]